MEVIFSVQRSPIDRSRRSISFQRCCFSSSWRSFVWAPFSGRPIEGQGRRLLVTNIHTFRWPFWMLRTARFKTNTNHWEESTTSCKSLWTICAGQCMNWNPIKKCCPTAVTSYTMAWLCWEVLLPTLRSQWIRDNTCIQLRGPTC